MMDADAFRARTPIANVLLRILNAAESNRAGPVHARCHQEEFTVFVEVIRLRKIPYRSLRLIVAAAAQDAGARVFVHDLFCPLPDISCHVHGSERTGALRVPVHRIWPTQAAAFVGNGNRISIPFVAPGIEAAVRTLRRILPLPLMRQALSDPGGIRASVFE